MTSPEFNKLTAEKFTERLKQENFATKADISDFVKKTKNFKLKNLNKKITPNNSKHLLFENEFKKTTR